MNLPAAERRGILIACLYIFSPQSGGELNPKEIKVKQAFTNIIDFLTFTAEISLRFNSTQICHI